MDNWTIISLGGSIIVPNKINLDYLRKFRDLILSMSDRRFVIICGGGGVNRTYNEAARSLGECADVDLDWIGIKSLQLNAELVRVMFGKKAYGRVLENPHELENTPKTRIIIGSADKPGRSSDYDAVLWAQKFKASTIINLSNIDKVFTADPRVDKKATPINDISWTDYIKIVGTKWTPRLSTPFDPVAAALAKKLGLTVYVMNGLKIDRVAKVINGDTKFVGTILHK